MKKPFKLLLIVLSLLIISSCSKNERKDPYELVETYVDLWQEYNFTKMYDMLSETTKQQYKTEDFIDRYEKIYQDLGIQNLSISILESEYEEEDTAVSFPIQVKMDSIAGPIEFTEEIELELVVDEETEEENWFVHWNPGLIFPQLKDGGKIKIERIEAKRGEILDRNEMPLAINDIAYEVGVVPNAFQNKASEIKQIASLLKMSEGAIEKAISADWVQSDHFVPLKTIPKADEQTVMQLENIPSVSMRETIGRVYPASEAAAHLVGYVGKVTSEELEKLPKDKYDENDIIGKRGLESLFEERLKGEDGVKILVVKEDEKGDPVSTVLAEKPVKDGEKMILTIDVNLQELLYEAYEGELKGAAAAIHPKTGEILALVSSPSFNPLRLTYGITQSEWDQLMNDEREPFVNRFSATYAPGSVIKPIIGAIGLNNGSITHEEELKIEGKTWKKDNWKDYHITRVSTADTEVNLEDALVSSDNIYFAMKAIDMGDKKLSEGLKEFGFGESLPLAFPFTDSQISNSGNLQDEILRANTGYGQGEIEVNVLHIALMYTPFVNEGNIVKPVLLKSNEKGEVWKKNVIKEDDAKKMSQYLRKIVTDGTARVIKDRNVKLAGKTGTAELKLTQDSKGHENGWFVGYDMENEDILIAMLMEEVEDRGTSSLVASKVADVIEAYREMNQ